VARGLLRDTLGGRDGRGDDALIMISELVTNAVRHSTGLLHVRITIDDQTLRVEVSDDDPTLPTAPDPDTGPDGTSGRGLRIVDYLADHRGVTPTDHGKTVWFEITLHQAGRASDAST
jgi:anti-sigma regulatory factor (Ser/Thr protein kinase)